MIFLFFLEFENDQPKGEKDWGRFDEEHFLKLTEEFGSLRKEMDKETSNDYFDQFIR